MALLFILYTSMEMVMSSQGEKRRTPSSPLRNSDEDKEFDKLLESIHSIKRTGPDMSYQQLYDKSPNPNFDCQQANRHIQQGYTTKPKVNFLSASWGYKYEDFIALYAFSSLSHNPHAFVEIVVSNVDRFKALHAYSLLYLQHLFGDAVCVRDFNIPTMSRQQMTSHPLKNTLRFFEVTQVLADFTYICDTDFFVGSSVVDDKKRMLQMTEWNIPYSDVIRKDSKRLTGIILVKTDEFFTQKYIEAQQNAASNNKMRSYNDEKILYILCKKVHGLPPSYDKNNKLTQYRPQHGFHMSWNRKPGGQMPLKFYWNYLTQTEGTKEFLSYSPKSLDILYMFFDYYKEYLKAQG